MVCIGSSISVLKNVGIRAGRNIKLNERCLENVYLRKAECTLFRQTSVTA